MLFPSQDTSTNFYFEHFNVTIFRHSLICQFIQEFFFFPNESLSIKKKKNP